MKRKICKTHEELATFFKAKSGGQSPLEHIVFRDDEDLDFSLMANKTSERERVMLDAMATGGGICQEKS